MIRLNVYLSNGKMKQTLEPRGNLENLRNGTPLGFIPNRGVAQRRHISRAKVMRQGAERILGVPERCFRHRRKWDYL